jgi:hypothetical protein
LEGPLIDFKEIGPFLRPWFLDWSGIKGKVRLVSGKNEEEKAETDLPRFQYHQVQAYEKGETVSRAMFWNPTVD